MGKGRENEARGFSVRVNRFNKPPNDLSKKPSLPRVAQSLCFPRASLMRFTFLKIHKTSSGWVQYTNIAV